MTKEVLVSLKGLQLSPDEQSDAVEVIAPAEYYLRNDKHYIDQIHKRQSGVFKKRTYECPHDI